MFKPVTSRLDTQIEATKKLENKGVREGDPLPEYPIEPEDGGDEMPNFEPPPPIDEDEMPNFEPPPPIDEDETEDEGEMSDFEPSTTRKRKEWTPSSFKKADQKKLDNERKYLAEERRRVNVLLGKLSKSGEDFIKSGKYEGKSYDELSGLSEDFTKKIDRIEDQLLLTRQKKQRMEYNKVPFSASDLQEKSKKLKKTPRKTKYKKKPAIEKALFDKIEGIRRETAPDSDSDREEEWEGSGMDQNYKVIYYKNPEKLIEKLDVICGSINAGNSSSQVRNQECKIIKTKFVSEKKGRGVGQTINKKIGDKIPGFQQAQDMASAIMAVTGADKDLFKKYWRGDFAKGKAVVIERFNRTLKNKMYKQFTIQGNTQYLEILPKIVKEYNNTKHSSIKMTPTEASKKKNEGTVYFNLYGDMEPLSAKPKFKVGDKVRISKYKRIVFDKGYTPNWSEEMFVITKIQHTNPITYKLKDLNNEDIQGSFYEPELLKAKQDVFRIDKVIRRDYKKKQALVKWKGYSDDFNSWIPMKDLQHI
ncbi:hypothetical protein ACROYT_G025217 [Oculina patagonica]